MYNGAIMNPATKSLVFSRLSRGMLFYILSREKLDVKRGPVERETLPREKQSKHILRVLRKSPVSAQTDLHQPMPGSVASARNKGVSRSCCWLLAAGCCLRLRGKPSKY